MPIDMFLLWLLCLWYEVQVMYKPILEMNFHYSAGASEGSEETKHWRGKRLFVNNDLPLQCFVCSEPSDASATVVYIYQHHISAFSLI